MAWWAGGRHRTGASWVLRRPRSRAAAGPPPAPDGAGPTYTLTPAGQEAVEKLIAARRASLARLLEGWSPDQHVDLAQLLTRLAGELVGERPTEAAAT